VQWPVGVEKVHFPQNSKNLGDRKCLGKLRKSFVGHPDAILFLLISREGVFQQPRLITTVVPEIQEADCLVEELNEQSDKPPTSLLCALSRCAVVLGHPRSLVWPKAATVERRGARGLRRYPRCTPRNAGPAHRIHFFNGGQQVREGRAPGASRPPAHCLAARDFTRREEPPSEKDQSNLQRPVCNCCSDNGAVTKPIRLETC
jgi:hypothetical protein